MCPEKKINVLMITGVYLPEINGAVLQCSQLINNLTEAVNYSVLTSTNDESMCGYFYIGGVSVTRVFMPKKLKYKYIIGAIWFYIQLIIKLRTIDLVHVHGFSRRNAIVIAICRILSRKVLLKMTSHGFDDPMSIKRGSPVTWKIFRCCHAYIGISPAFLESFKKAKLLERNYSFIPNSVDSQRFCPVTQNQKNALRYRYGFLVHDKVIVFVGHFSHEKQPMLIYRAWVALWEQNIFSTLIFIGHTKNHFEVDEGIIESMSQDALQRGILPFIHFVEETSHVDEYMKIADVFVLPSKREGLPNALLEAMACALPCIVSYLPGVTDWLIDDGVTGTLVRSNDPEVWARKIATYLAAHGDQPKIGLAAQHFIESNFLCASTSQRVLDLYWKMIGEKS